MDLEKIALNFVNSLVPGKFEKAKEKLSSDCKYKYEDKTLEGDAIIQSFIDNHNHAKTKLDKIDYIDGVVRSIENSLVTVVVKDLISFSGIEHTYTDRLIVGINKAGEVESIEYKPFPEEREKLSKYFEENEIKF